MWMETTTENGVFDKNQIQPHNTQQPSEGFDRYLEDDDTATDTGRTMSSIADNSHLQHDSPPFVDHMEETSTSSFEKIMKDPENSRVSRYQNTYFMDGGNRFISLPTLGNTSTKAASHISRIFEDWLQNKLYYQSTNDGLERLPILEDSVELLAEDVVNKLKSRNSVRGLTGLSRIMIKIRTGHVYTYHQLEDGQPLITADMEDFFQQFPLFVEIIIYTMPKDSDQSWDDVQLLLAVENITVNPSDPYHIKEDIPLVA
ncbi:uncharacterized protein ATC70_013476 [Mucor velutinosus]|uniref:Uncharacterized protein n=1 Tax=Mucor velutinosus TaxID=708070 RepID=A0AAN7HVB7_9FUNG|nr:hypothetical protein ATC70_013476 [Mucor velutinosus]